MTTTPQSLTTAAEDVPAFSFLDPEYQRDPHPTLARLRAADPIHKSPFGWVVTSHADVVRLNRDPRCGRDTRKLRSGGLGALAAGRPGLLEMASTVLLHIDPPDHARIRKLMAYAFTPKAIAAMEEPVQRVAWELTTRLADHGDIELMRDFAKPFPVTVIADLMEVPREELPHLMAWGEAIAEHLEPTASAEQFDAADTAFVEFKQYLADFVEQKRRAPGSGLVDRLIAAEREAGALSGDELLANIVLLLVAGHETTTNLIGNGVLALLQHPAELALLRERPQLAASAVEECLRWESPVNTNGRCANETLEIGGRTIRQGQLIICMLGAANRDPAVFRDPDRFDIRRDPNPHQSFGGGPHHCLGAHLARLEGRIALTTLLSRYARIELVPGRAAWSHRINLRGLRELGIAVTR